MLSMIGMIQEHARSFQATDLSQAQDDRFFPLIGNLDGEHAIQTYQGYKIPKGDHVDSETPWSSR